MLVPPYYNTTNNSSLLHLSVMDTRVVPVMDTMVLGRIQDGLLVYKRDDISVSRRIADVQGD